MKPGIRHGSFLTPGASSWITIPAILAGIACCSPTGRNIRLTSTQRTPGHAGFETATATIAEIHEAFRNRRLTVVELVSREIQRIHRHDKRGMSINAILETNPEALSIARRLDSRLKRTGKIDLPLFGIPIVLKDNICTRDRMGTTAGSHYLTGSAILTEAPVVQELRKAGAVILAKGNMDELAMSAIGLPSGRGGQTRNPYMLARMPGGSSGGPAAAVAVGFAVLALGTDTLGSTRIPASDCSLVALKPTTGLFRSGGMVPCSPLTDVYGPMARSVSDLAILTEVLAATGDRSPVDKTIRPMKIVDQLAKGGLKGARIGVLRQATTGATPEFVATFDGAVTALRTAGAIVLDDVKVSLPQRHPLDREERTILVIGALRALDTFLRGLGRGSPVRSLRQLLFLRLASPLPSSGRVFGSRISILHSKLLKDILVSEGRAFDGFHEHRYQEAGDKLSQAFKKPLVEAMDRHRLDALFFLTKLKPTAAAMPRTPEDLAASSKLASAGLASFSGLPEITVPTGYTTSGFPVGVSFLGRSHDEPRLFKLAFGFEAATKHRRPPRARRRAPEVAVGVMRLPGNDAFGKRAILNGRSGAVEGNTLLATVEPDEPRHAPGHGTFRSVWYTWSAPASGDVELKLTPGQPPYNFLSVYRGDQLSNLRRLPGDNKVLRVTVKKGDRLEIAASSGRDVYLGNFRLTWKMTDK